MKWMLLSLLVACGIHPDECPQRANCGYIAVPDAAIDVPVEHGCQILTQAGCDAGDKCTWVRSTDGTADAPALGSIDCAPDGTKAVGAACTVGKVAMGGYDDCVAGAICIAGTCETICDNEGGAPACGSGQACVTHAGIFANAGAATVPAGACDPSCDPLNDNDFDGSGTRFTKSGTVCSSDPTIGCYGAPSKTSTTHFSCATPIAGTELLTHRALLPSLPATLNVCMPGYELGVFYADDSGAMTPVCLAWCKPGDAYLGNPNPNQPNGVAPHRCNTDDALGAFGTPASDTQNGEHCMYSWVFEIDDTNAFHRSPTSDTLGICIDHTKYTYDPTGTGSGSSSAPPCSQLPLEAAGAAGCVRSTLVTPTLHRPRQFVSLPELR